VRGRQPASPGSVEHDNHTLLVHISDEDRKGWTTVAIDRGSRAWSLAQRDNQLDAASTACNALYSGRPRATSWEGRDRADHLKSCA
jgi:hypothetical protein